MTQSSQSQCLSAPKPPKYHQLQCHQGHHHSKGRRHQALTNLQQQEPRSQQQPQQKEMPAQCSSLRKVTSKLKVPDPNPWFLECCSVFMS
jgi:hypothetical protein